MGCPGGLIFQLRAFYNRLGLVTFLLFTLPACTGSDFHVFVQPDTSQNRLVPEVLYINILIFSVKIVMQTSAYIEAIFSDFI